MRIVIIVAFILILASLASALFFMMRDGSRTPNMVRSLTVRVGLSIALFVFIMIAFRMGWIQSTGIPASP
ncbi:twin transmembrane helix small protein [Paracidovorax citrulli]